MVSDDSIIEVIRKRRSWRTYIPEAMEEQVREKLEIRLAEKHLGPFPGQVRFRLIELQNDPVQAKQKIGTYGMIKDARYYIVGAVTRGEKALENYGYLFEKIILAATEMGLGTCWVGGALHRNDIARRIEATKEEYIPAISPVGKVVEKRALRDQMVSLAAGSKNRKKWQELFFYNHFSTPLRKEDVPEYANPLEMVRLGPSASNRQPWRIVKEGGRPRFHFYLQKNRFYGKIAHSVLGAEDIQYLDMGIAMCHFAMAAKEQGLQGRWLVAPPTYFEPPEGVEYSVSWIEN
ncbi:nitroreductase family protein [bacterium]|nr:nitroreductase family protein [bacterium]